MTMRIAAAGDTHFTRRFQGAVQERVVNVAIMVACLALASAAFAEGIDLSGITSLVCKFAEQLKATELLGAAGVVIVLVFGWNKLMGEGNAFQGLKNGAIGAIVILSAGTIATAVFGAGGC
ncbi:hypothetical protein [Deinococcus hopiensis]|uniref:TrbC/VIRB2 family protein n=1 Tax=Deinococcus hopiensis KR-140 TaxID=695939 RepID=A0A1W1UAY1_9DEIO|nr:hypothetical protein [Deinococcus hopiensis]SMB77924.1 hypothetical protein SAMN00790413_04006 [Deinococcus hopiensis KR-140]